MSKHPPRAWQRMLSGRRLNLLDPAPIDVEISDIARGLACVARWNGQTSGQYAFCVAQHSLIVADICCDILPTISPTMELMALLHDAPEYVIGDMISPFKTALGLEYQQFEQKLEAAIHIRFGLPATPSRQAKKLIKQADIACAYYEAIYLADFCVGDADKFFEKPKNLSQSMQDKLTKINPISAKDAEQAFLTRFNQISKAIL